MAWGFFNKVAKVANDSAKILRDKAIPLGKNIVNTGKDIYEIGKPVFDNLGWGRNIGKILETSDDVLNYADDVSEMVNAKDVKTGMKRGVDLYQRSRNYK